MSKLKGVNISSPVVPFDSRDSYPTHYAKYGNGGLQVVNSLSDLDSITQERIEEGMLVYVLSDETHIHSYQYLGGEWRKAEIGKDILQFLDSDGWTYDSEVLSDGTVRVYNLIKPDRQNEPEPGTGKLYSGLVQINSIYMGDDSDEHSFNLVSHNYVELTNLLKEDLNLNGLFLLYTPDNGETWEKLELKGTIKAGSNFIIRGAQSSIIENAKVKVEYYNMIWLDSNNQLIKFTNPGSSSFYLAWGTEQGKLYSLYEQDFSIDYPSDVKEIYNNGEYADGFIDLVGFGNNNSICEVSPYDPGRTDYINCLFKRHFELDPSSDAININNNSIAWRYIYLPNDFYSGFNLGPDKNINTNKMKFSTTEPNTVNMTLGFHGTIKNDSTENYATRCITWTSVGYFDEEVLFRKIETGRGWSHAESFNEETTVYEFAPEHIVNNYKDLYNRIVWETYSGQVITTHKVIIKLNEIGPWEFKIQRKNDSSYTSPTYQFEIKSSDIIEYSVCHLSNLGTSDHSDAIELNIVDRVINKTNIQLFDFNIITGNVVKHGGRPEEWLEYFNSRKPRENLSGIYHIIPDIYTPGPNDLCEIKTWYKPSTEKSQDLHYEQINQFAPWLFYTYEMNPEISTKLPGLHSEEIDVPWLYSFWYGDNYYISMNSELIAKHNIHENRDTSLTVLGYIDDGNYKRSEDFSGRINISFIYEKMALWFVNCVLQAHAKDIITDYTIDSDIKDLAEILKDNEIIDSLLKQSGKIIPIMHEAPIDYLNNQISQAKAIHQSGNIIFRDCIIRATRPEISTDSSNLNLHYSYGFSKLFYLSGIRFVISGSKPETVMTYPIYDLSYDSWKSHTPNTSWNRSDYTDLILQQINETLDTTLPVIQNTASNPESIRENLKLPLIRNQVGDLFNNCENETVLSDILTRLGITAPEPLNYTASTNSKQTSVFRIEFIEDITKEGAETVKIAPRYVNMGPGINVEEINKNKLVDRKADNCKWIVNNDRDLQLAGNPCYGIYTFANRIESSLQYQYINVSIYIIPNISATNQWDLNIDLRGNSKKSSILIDNKVNHQLISRIINENIIIDR